MYIKLLINRLIKKNNKVVKVHNFKNLSCYSLLILCRKILSLLYNTWMVKHYCTIYYSNVDNKFILLNCILILKLYFFSVVRNNFCIYQSVNNNFLFNLTRSLNTSYLLFFLYLLVYCYVGNTLIFINNITTLIFFSFISELLFYVLVSRFFIVNFILFCLFDILVRYLLFNCTIFNYLFTLIINSYIIVSGIYFFSIIDVLFVIQKILSVFLLFNVDFLLYPNMVYSPFYTTYKLIIYNYLLIRKILTSVIYFITLHSDIILVSRMTIFSILALLCFFLLHKVLSTDNILLLGFKSVNNMNSYSSIIFCLYFSLLIYGYNKIILLKNKSVYSNYYVTFFNLFFYIIFSLLLKSIIYFNLLNIDIYFCSSIAWLFSYICSILVLLYF